LVLFDSIYQNIRERDGRETDKIKQMKREERQTPVLFFGFDKTRFYLKGTFKNHPLLKIKTRRKFKKSKQQIH